MIPGTNICGTRCALCRFFKPEMLCSFVLITFSPSRGLDRFGRLGIPPRSASLSRPTGFRPFARFSEDLCVIFPCLTRGMEEIFDRFRFCILMAPVGGCSLCDPSLVPPISDSSSSKGPGVPYTSLLGSYNRGPLSQQVWSHLVGISDLLTVVHPAPVLLCKNPFGHLSLFTTRALVLYGRYRTPLSCRGAPWIVSFSSDFPEGNGSINSSIRYQGYW